MRPSNSIFTFKITKTIVIMVVSLFAVRTVLGRESIVLQNDAYTITVPPDFDEASLISISKHDHLGFVRKISAALTVFYSPDNPEYGLGRIREGNSPVATWGKGAAETEMDLWKIGEWNEVKATIILRQHSQKVTFGFDPHPLFDISLNIRLDEGKSTPVLTWELVPREDGWYSVGFTGLKSSEPAVLNFLYQPMVWTWKRFPVTAVVTPEAFSTTAATFVNKDGFTEGIAIDPSEIPYRFATFENSRFGLALRTANGRAKPMALAPIPGGAESKMKVGQTYRFSCRYFLQTGDWMAGTDYLYSEIIGFKTERRNATISLNQTLENMIAFAMDDLYSGWVSELKGSDYRFDVPGTVKNVSALHPLSTALTTGNLEIYRRRALPMIEYVLSREKYLYAVSDDITQQNPSHFLKGPCVEISELASLHQMTGGVNSVFAKEAERIFGKSRQLNLITETGGGSWQDHLAKFRISGNASDLDQAVKLANAYLDASYDRYPEDFNTSAGLKDFQATFVTDYTLAWYDLLELYEETEEQRFRDAAITGARQMLLWMRSNPMAPDSVIVANEGGRVPGVFPGRRYTSESYKWKEFDTSTKIQEQEVPAWRTSLAGLLPEVPYTYMYGPIMLAHHAAWMLRMAHLSGAAIFKDAAYNSVIGRYASFPGYYFTSMNTTVYQQPNYPLQPYMDIKYNAVFYNHIWPHIALLQDFLVSDAYLKSKGEVLFPSAYAPGYAFLSSKVYGHEPGEIFGNKNVMLWLPRNAIQSSEITLNHLFGRDQQNSYLVLMNTSNRKVVSELFLNPNAIRWNQGTSYTTITYQSDMKQSVGVFINGKINVEVPPQGLIAIKIEGLKNEVPLQERILNAELKPQNEGYFRKKYPQPALGTITGMLINLVSEFSDAYIYSSTTEKEAESVSLHYQLGNEEWQKETDLTYPFEFSLRIEDPKKSLKFKWEAESSNGNHFYSDEFFLKN